jgi:predicted site-specific integrase-resolvase
MSPSKARRFVAYYRVSTERQGTSGLGLEAQQKAVRDYLNGTAWELVAEHIEIESGKRADRPELVKALEACKRHKARLVIAKLDRLSRNLAFVATLMDAGVEFTAVDNPHANKLTVHILAAVAQHEREMISERTTAALQAAKARGVRLLERLQPPPPVTYILAIASCDGLIQQPNGIITREVEATHRLRRRIIVTGHDCIAIETDAILVLVHRSFTLFRPSFTAKAITRHKQAPRRLWRPSSQWWPLFQH